MPPPPRFQDRFWRKILSPIGWVYGTLTLRRMAKKGLDLPVPVISIGNFTAGGGGKTPTTLALALHLQQKGERPFIVTRGYGGGQKKALKVDLSCHQVQDVGDEALLLAKYAPVIVARNRAEGAQLALKQGASCLLLDDGLQNPHLTKHISLAVVDRLSAFGNKACLPAGPLRAPIAQSLAFVDALLVIGEGGKDNNDILSEIPEAYPVFKGQLAVDATTREQWQNQEVISFCGLAHPQKFIDTLQKIGVKVGEHHSFADHYPYRQKDAAMLLARSQKLNLPLLTTEKDYMRFISASSPFLQQLRAKSHVLPVSLQAQAEFWVWLDQAFAAARIRCKIASMPE